MMWEGKYFDLLEIYNKLIDENFGLEVKYKRLQSEHNILKTLHTNVLENCINDKIKLQKRIKKLRRINNERIL